MVLEVAILNIRPGQSEAFEAAFLEAQQIISASLGYQRHELRQCVETGNQYLLLVWWNSLESHTKGFRQSPEYQRWRELLHHFYDPFPTVEHYVGCPGPPPNEGSADRAAPRGASMASTITGRCLCGHVTYEYGGSIGPANYCHCEDCRRCTGSAFNIGVRLRLVDFRITSGDPKEFTKSGDSGRELTRHFCPECGSPLFTSAPKHPDYVYLKAGTLDDARVVEPAQQNWVVSAVPWSQIGSDLRSFAKGSESGAA